MHSWKWHIRKLNRLYYFLMFRLADFLFVGDKCPECGCYLRHNYTGFGMCEEFYCPKCIEKSMKLRTYTISDLRRIDGSYSNRTAEDDWSKLKERDREMTNTFHCTVKSTESCGHYKLAEKLATHKIKTLFGYVTMSPQMLAKKTIGSMPVRDPKSYDGGYKNIFVSPFVPESFDTWGECFESTVRALEEQYDEIP